MVHCLNLLTALGWQSLNWRDEEMHGWIDGWMQGRREKRAQRESVSGALWWRLYNRL